MPSLLTLAGERYEPDLPSRLLSIAGEIRSAGGRAFLVGGWVRDALLGKDCRDYDIEVYDLTQDELIPILKKYGRTNLVGKAFGVIHLAMKGLSLDFSFPRTESKVGYGHRGFVVHTDERYCFGDDGQQMGSRLAFLCRNWCTRDSRLGPFWWFWQRFCDGHSF